MEPCERLAEVRCEHLAEVPCEPLAEVRCECLAELPCEHLAEPSGGRAVESRAEPCKALQRCALQRFAEPCGAVELCRGQFDLIYSQLPSAGAGSRVAPSLYL